MGFFSWGKSSKDKKGTPSKDAAESPGGKASTSGSGSNANKELEAEVKHMRAREEKLVQTIAELRKEQDNGSREAAAAQEKLNMLDFKYQLLMDMWAMRELDADEDTRQGNRGGVMNSVQSIDSDNF
mmetsp:Transcript_27018/g.32799  ORF Transcript_27018/g.32799 Transcript_27018/m.32799 type:complete len:127 (+) Transcript_27018:108-488(+)